MKRKNEKLFSTLVQQCVISFSLKKNVLWPLTFLLVRRMKRYGDKRLIQMKSTTETTSGKSIRILNREWRLEFMTDAHTQRSISGNKSN